MEFRLDEGQVALQETVARFCAARVPLDLVAGREGEPLDRATWQEMAGLGVFGLLLPEDAGGAGLGAVEAAIVYEQLGSHLVPGPVLWTILAAPLVDGAASGEVVVGGVLADDVVDGEAIVEHATDLDVGLPDGSGLDLLADLRAAGWPRLVVLSAADDPYSVRAAFVAGAQGYLLKSASPLVVADGVRRVLDGGVYADPSVASLLAAGLRGGPQHDGVAELSGREVEVLQLVADGRSNKEIGESLGLSALTVKSHLARIARKLGTGDRAEMVAMAMRAGVIR